MRKLYALFAILVIGGFSWTALTGYELSAKRRQFVPQSQRGHTGGAGSVWYRGYHGGK